MARKRDIDPSLWDHDELGSLPAGARLLFVGLISNADDEGRLKGTPRHLKGLVFRYDDAITVDQVREWRDQLVSQGHVCRYDLGLDAYVHLPSWHRWQSINRQMISKIPPCPKHGPCPRHEADRDDVSTHGAFTEEDVTAHDPLSESSVSTHDALSEHDTTTGPDRSGPVRTATVTGPDRAGAVPGEGSPAATPSARKRAPSRPPRATPPPARFRKFDGYLKGMRGYAPNPAFWDEMAEKWSGLDLTAEAAKILDYLGRRPNTHCSNRFLITWLNRALADAEQARATADLAESRLNGHQKGKYHAACKTTHEDWDECPADADMPPVRRAGYIRPKPGAAVQEAL